MSRTARLLEVMISLRDRPRFTVAELAAHFGVSRRTMLRDLHALSEMGVPLVATPGPHGGYGLISDRQALPLTLTAEEAIGIAISYDAFLRYAQSPFAAQSLSAITKLRASLPADILGELDRISQHIAVIERPRYYDAQFLTDLLNAALDGVHLLITYDSASGRSERTIFPHGLYAAAGFWYCACYDYRRSGNISLRADRILALHRVAGLPRPEPIAIRDWLTIVETLDGREGHEVRLQATLTARGMKRFEFADIAGSIIADGLGGGNLDLIVPRAELAYYARRFLAVGPDARAKSPPELIDAIRQQALATLNLYPQPPTTGPDR
ncbi:MAG TPA: WYL domain-containing protein [Thermomicrobiales bacterium]|jgi:predicted DNA-binding transcriptional regulator YafY